jgi:hypothetical protein
VLDDLSVPQPLDLHLARRLVAEAVSQHVSGDLVTVGQPG